MLDLPHISASEIQNRLHKYGKIPGNTENTRGASVLVPLFKNKNRWHLLFIHRSSWVNSHKDQVSFPGGMAEQGDENVISTALRETWEEVGILPKQVKVLGQLTPIVFRNDYQIFPVVGVIPWPIELNLSPVEVSHVFSIPINWLANPAHFSQKPYISEDGHSGEVYFYKKYKGELLWGISAYITISLINQLK